MTFTTWIVTTTPDGAVGEHLLAAARGLGGEVVAVVVAPGAAPVPGVDRVLALDHPVDVPAEACATTLAERAAADRPDVVLGASRSAERVLLGAVAARLDAPVTAAHGVRTDGDTLVVERDVLGGVAQETAAADGPVVLVLDAGAEILADDGAVAGVAVERMPVVPAAVVVVEERPAVPSGVDLASARRVVGVGRGLRAQEDLALVEELADALDAATACSRPVAEGVGFLPKDRYLGVSGRVIAPELYLALGISGQLQHMVGVRGARTIVAVNTDPKAPVFGEADYCLVGDLYEVVPALTRALAR